MKTLHEYQNVGVDFLVSRLHEKSGAGLWVDPGMGKTAITLHAMDMLRFDGVRRILLVAPARVLLSSWPSEIKDWGFDYSCALLQGSIADRERILKSDPDILCVTSEGCGAAAKKFKAGDERDPVPNVLDWLEGTKYRANLCVVDESTKFKNWSSLRSKRLRRILRRVPKCITLTGTPAPNCLGDVFSQHYLVDRGETLGTGIGKFRERYMYKGGFKDREWLFNDSKQPELEEALAPWYLRQAALGNLDLPKLLVNVIRIEMPPAAKKAYKQMEKEMFAELDGGTTVLAFTGGARYNLCRQITSGAAYDEDHRPISVHTAKLDALESLYDELHGKQLLVAYCFTHELAAIKSRWPNAGEVNGKTTDRQFIKTMEDWRANKITMLAVQCQAMSHGVDGLQKSNCADICWYSLTDNPEINTQLIARVWRQGNVAEQVRVHYLIAPGTVDVAIKKTLDAKDGRQGGLLQAISDLRAAA